MAATVVVAPLAHAAELTATERAWLRHAHPVLAFAHTQALPLDVIVQPQPMPGESPVGMAFVGGRCKLVLSMRDNPEAQATLDSIAPGLHAPVVESIIAHELAHCWRHHQRSWGSLPDGFEESAGLRKVSTDAAALLRDMWRTRREEGFADLVGLAWTQRHHPQHYAQVHAWLVRRRADPPVYTGPHDTRAWVQLAADATRFRQIESLFEQVDALWLAGLLEGI